MKKHSSQPLRRPLRCRSPSCLPTPSRTRPKPALSMSARTPMAAGARHTTSRASKSKKHFGGAVNTRFIENVAEASSEGAIERLARSGCDIIFTTSFGFMDPTLAVAERFPDVKFEHATGYKTAPNVAVYNSRFYEGRYIQGVIAASFPKPALPAISARSPSPKWFRASTRSFSAHAVDQSRLRPCAWSGPTPGTTPVQKPTPPRALMDQGVDIITQHTNSTAPMQEAAARGIKAFGQASDMIEAGPETQLTAILDTWAPYYIERIQAVLDGTWESRKHLGRACRRHPLHGALHQHARRRRRHGRGNRSRNHLWRDSFPSPARSTARTAPNGSPKANQADDGTLLSLNFYVEGVDGQLPN